MKRPSELFTPTPRDDPALRMAQLKKDWLAYPLKNDGELQRLASEITSDDQLLKAIKTACIIDGLFVPEVTLGDILPTVERIDSAKVILAQVATLIGEHKPKDNGGITLSTVPFISICRDPRQLVSDIVYKISALTVPATDQPIFPKLSAQLRKNVALASGYEHGARPNQKYINPLKSDLPPIQLAKAYLQGTPFYDVVMQPVPYQISDAARVEHWHILARTGHGKSQTLQYIIHQDIIRPDPPAIVLIDPKGDMVAAIQKLVLFGDDPKRVAIIDPKYGPQLNVFATSLRKRKVSNQTRKAVMDSYLHMFSAIDTDLSTNQSLALSCAVELVLAFDGDMRLFLDVLADPATDITKSNYQDKMQSLDEFTSHYFATQYHKGMVPGSRRSLANKVHYLIRTNDAFKRMFFLAKDNTLDMFERIQTPGSVTLINASISQLGAEGSSFFGRYMVAQTLAASNEVGGLLRSQRKVAYLVIDEAHLYFDENLENSLNMARSSNLGVIFAHQNITQMKWPSLKSAVLGMPAMRLAAPIDEDQNTIARVMKTTPNFLEKLEKQQLTFAAYNKKSDQEYAVRVKIPFLSVEHAPQATPEQLASLIESNRTRFSPPPPEPEAKEEKVPDEKPEAPKPRKKRFRDAD